MKKFYLISICLIAIIVLTAGIVVLPEKDKDVAEKLLCERVDILNNYYEGNATVDETYDMLKVVEYGDILTEDTAGLDAYAQTDIDQVISYKIKSIRSRQSIYGYIEGRVTIEWVMKNLHDKYKTDIEYSFRCNEVNGKYKITHFNIIT